MMGSILTAVRGMVDLPGRATRVTGQLRGPMELTSVRGVCSRCSTGRGNAQSRCGLAGANTCLQASGRLTLDECVAA